MPVRVRKTPFTGTTFRMILAVLWAPFCDIWVSFGANWVPFGANILVSGGGRVDGLAKSQPTGAQLESPDAIRSHIVLTHIGLTLGWGRFLTQ